MGLENPCVSIQAIENLQSARRPESEGIFFNHNKDCGEQIMDIGCGIREKRDHLRGRERRQ